MRSFQTLQYRAEMPKQLPFLDYTSIFADADFEYILNYSSNVIKITQDGKVYFFKEARKRPNTLRAYVWESIDTFFDEIVHNPSLQEKTLDSLKKRQNFQRLIHMGYKNVRGDRLHRYLVSGNEACVGLPQPATQEEKDQMRKLIFYVSGELQNWYYNAGVKAGKLQTFSAIRALATQELARLLGVDSLIVRCNFVKIELGGKIRYGVLSEQADGDSLISCPYEHRASLATPQLLRALTNLNLLDVLTHDNDHRVGNYHVTANEPGVLSFDNDSPDSFCLSANVRFTNLTGCSALIDHRGLINRAHLDQDTASALLALQRSDLNTLAPYLSSLQLRAVWLRVCKVKKAIVKTLALRNDLLLEKDQWCAEHIGQDLSAKYEKTYLSSLLSDCYFETGMHEFDTL